MITPFMSNDKLKDKQLQQNAERNRNASEKTKEASLINRKITNQLAGLSIDASSASEQEMLEALLNERDMELAAEGKRWYDLLRFGRSKGGIYKNAFISIIESNNITANTNWLHSTLVNDDAWFLPVNQTEMESNPLLIQNPYYTGITA